MRWREIAEELTGRIESGELKTGDRVPTNAKLAEEAGVSLLTAHKALEELQREGLVVRSGRRGTVVAPRLRKRTGRIALIMDQIDFVRNFPRPELLGGIHSALGDRNLIVCDSKASIHREIELLQQMAEEADGILCWSTGDDAVAPALERMVSKGVPLVLLDRIPGQVRADSVLTNSISATRAAAEFLIGRGHRRVGLLTFDKPEVSTVAERCGTFESIMSEHELWSPELVRRFPASLEVQDKPHFPQVFHDAMFTLLNGASPATAVLCVQDLLGVAVLEYAQQMDLKIPDQLEVVTFNDWPPHWLCYPWQAHRIAVQPQDMGRMAMERLTAQIQGSAGQLGIHYIPTLFIPADSLVGSTYDFQPDRPQEVY